MSSRTLGFLLFLGIVLLGAFILFLSYLALHLSGDWTMFWIILGTSLACAVGSALIGFVTMRILK